MPYLIFFLNATECTEATIYRNNGAGDETGVVAAKELNNAVEFGDVAEALHRGAGQHFFAALGVTAIGVDEDGPVLVANEEARCNGVDPDFFVEFGRHFHRQPLGPDVYAGLGYRVARNPCDGRIGGHRRNIDDAALALFGHGFAKNNGGINRSVEVQVVYFIKIFKFHVEDGLFFGKRSAGHIAAGSIYQYVDASPVGYNLFAHGGETLPVEYIANQPFHSACFFQIGHSVVEGFLANVEDNHFNTRFEQTLGNAASQYASSSCNHGYTAV